MKDYSIGIVGGMGSYATVDFFRRIIDAFPVEKEWERPRIFVDNYCTMPSRVRAILYNERREELIKCLNSSVENLLDVGVERIILACNTSHVFLPYLLENFPNEKDVFINIIEECGKSIEKTTVRNVGLIATEGTIETNVYSMYLDKYNIKISSPLVSQYEELREFIEAVKQNKITNEVMNKFEKYLEEFSQEAVILGCTEIPILYNCCVRRGYMGSKMIFDPLQSVIERIVDEYNQEE